MQVEKIDTFSGHRGAVYALDGGNSNEFFYSGGSDGMLVQWNLQKPDLGKGIAQFQKGIFTIKYVAQTNHMWIATHLEGIHVIDLSTNQEVFSFAELSYSFFTFELIGDFIFAGNSGGYLCLFDALSKQFIKSVRVCQNSIRKIISISTDRLLVASSDGTIRLIDLNGKLIWSGNAHQNTVFSLAYNSLDQELFTVGKDAKVKKWKFSSDQFFLQDELVGHIFPIHDIVFDASCKLFATSSMDKTIKIWDAAQFKLLKVLDFSRHGGHKNSVNKLYWSDYQGFLVSASDDKKISVWKLNS